MKKGLFALLMIAVTALTFVAVGALTAADVPDEVTIENEGYKKDKKGAVKLSHKKHNTDYKVACTECHHNYQDGKNVWKEGDPVKKCMGCHDPLKGRKDSPKGLRSAYHNKNSCVGRCHKDALKEGKKNAPKSSKCSACHSKK